MYKKEKKQKTRKPRGKYIETTHENRNCKTLEKNISKKPKEEEERKRKRQISFQMIENENEKYETKIVNKSNNFIFLKGKKSKRVAT